MRSSRRCTSLSRSPTAVLAQPGRSSRCAAACAAHRGCLQRQHDAELAEQAADAVDGRGALLDEALARAVHHSRDCCSTRSSPARSACSGAARPRRSPRHRRRRSCRACRSCGRARRTWAPSAARCGRAREQPRPVVRARACFHADRARRQRRHQLQQLGARARSGAQRRLACSFTPCSANTFLARSMPTVDNSHGLPLPSELMRVRTSHRGTSLPVAASRLARDGEVPFIR